MSRQNLSCSCFTVNPQLKPKNVCIYRIEKKQELSVLFSLLLLYFGAVWLVRGESLSVEAENTLKSQISAHLHEDQMEVLWWVDSGALALCWHPRSKSLSLLCCFRLSAFIISTLSTHIFSSDTRIEATWTTMTEFWWSVNVSAANEEARCSELYPHRLRGFWWLSRSNLVYLSPFWKFCSASPRKSQ